MANEFKDPIISSNNSDVLTQKTQEWCTDTKNKIYRVVAPDFSEEWNTFKTYSQSCCKCSFKGYIKNPKNIEQLNLDKGQTSESL